MARFLFTVEDRFLIRGRGLVIVPGVTPYGDERFHVGDSVRLNRPDGSVLASTIRGLEIVHQQPYKPPSEQKIPLLLAGLTKDDVPIGTEVWSVDHAE